MKTMKKLAVVMVAVAAVFGVFGVARADDDKPVTVQELPQAAQTFIKTYFSGKQVALAKADIGLFNNDYDVIFTDGSKIEFKGDGNWTEVKCKEGVPGAIVPKQIADFLKTNYNTPGMRILKIERDNHGYDLRLSTGMELEFNSSFQLVDIDN